MILYLFMLHVFLQILSHLEHIDAGEVSEVKGYLQKVLKNEGNLGTESEMNGTDDNRAPRVRAEDFQMTLYPLIHNNTF